MYYIGPGQALGRFCVPKTRYEMPKVAGFLGHSGRAKFIIKSVVLRCPKPVIFLKIEPDQAQNGPENSAQTH